MRKVFLAVLVLVVLVPVVLLVARSTTPVVEVPSPPTVLGQATPVTVHVRDPRGIRKLEASIEPTAKDTAPREVKLGTLKIPAGIAPVRVVPVGIESAELIRLFSVTLVPRPN